MTTLCVMLLSSMYTWPPVKARPMLRKIDMRKISPRPLQHDQVSKRSKDIPDFGEAPAFINGQQCLILNHTSDQDAVCNTFAIHITMTLDVVYLRGTLAAIMSILQHTGCPENVFFHFLVSNKDEELLHVVHSTFSSLKFKIYHFDEGLVKSRISSSLREALEQPLNYARNYLPNILESCVEKTIYLDSDVVVVDDIANLWESDLRNSVLAAPEYCHVNFSRYFTSAFWENESLASTFKGRTPCYFNTGVMVMDLTKWRQKAYTTLIEQWMDVQRENRIYELGSLPPFLLVFAGSVEPIDHKWNQHGLGGDNWEGRCRSLHPGPVSLLHWSGKGKPWTRLDDKQPCPLDRLWASYDLMLNVVDYD